MLRNHITLLIMTTFAPAVVGIGSAARGEDSLAGLVYEAAEPLNLLIDDLGSDLERAQQRELVKETIANSLRQGKLGEAQEKAEQYSFYAPSPELRAAWHALAKRLDEEIAKREASTRRRAEAFYEKLPEVWTATSPEEVDQILALLDGPPLQLEPQELDRLTAARNAATRWQLVLLARQEGNAAAALQGIQDLDPQGLPVPADRLAEVRDETSAEAEKRLTAEVHTVLRTIMAAKSPEEAASNLAKTSSTKTKLLRNLRRGTREYEMIDNLIAFASAWDNLCEQRALGRHGAVADIADNLLNVDYPVLEEEIRAIRNEARDKATNDLETFVAESKQDLIEADTTQQFLDVCGRLKNKKALDIASSDTPGFVEATALVKLAWPLFEAATHIRNEERVAAEDRLNQILKTPIDDDLKVRIASLRDANQQAMHDHLAAILDEGRERVANCKQASEARLAHEWIRRHKLPTLATPTTANYAQVSVLNTVAAVWEKLFTATEEDAVGVFEPLATELEQLKPLLDAEGQLWFAAHFQQTIDHAKRQAAILREAHKRQIDAHLAEAETSKNYGLLLRELQSETYGSIRSPIADDIANFAQETEVLLALQESIAKDGLEKIREFVRSRTEAKPHIWSEWADAQERSMILTELSTSAQIEPLAAQRSESVRAALLRAADEAVEKQDWRMVVRVLEAYQAAFGTNSWLSAEISGCSSFHQALALERAGDIVAARQAYIRVLAHNAARVPHEQAEARLVALRQKYPKVFELPLPPVDG